MSDHRVSGIDAVATPHQGMSGEREEVARAETYDLLASLFYAPPTAQLYARLRAAATEAPVPGAFLEASWSGLVASARRLALPEVDDEHAALFGGVGKPEVLMYGSWFMAGNLNEQPLADLRRDLAELGLERPAGVLETEDHIACLCQVMRFLVIGDDPEVSKLTAQRRIFDAHLRPWVERLCDTVIAHPRADFYRELGGFARDFFAVEAQGFDLLDA